MNKKFDCVKFQREQRQKLADKLAKMPKDDKLKYLNSLKSWVKEKSKI